MIKNTMLMIATLFSTHAVAEDRQNQAKTYQLEIASQPLPQAINKLSEATGLEIIFFSEIAEGKTSSMVSGNYTPDQAIDFMLAGTDLQRIELDQNGAMGIKPISSQMQGQGQKKTTTQSKPTTVRPENNQTNETKNDSNPPPTNGGSSDQETTDDFDTILVTGSRIRETNIISPIPTVTVTVEEIEAAGTVDLGEIVEEIPGVYLGLSPTNTLLSTQNAGLSAISLRSLGTNRTLTLINGRRVVSNSGNAQRVDTATIPAGFIDRVDITTGGASAVYGSDAIAGVANIILKNDYEGFDFNVRYEDSDEGGRDTTSANFTWGSAFAEDRGQIMIGGNWEERNPLLATDRDYALNNLEIDLETGELEPNLSSFLPGGRFEVGDAWNNNGIWQNDQEGSIYCLDDGRVPACDDYQSALDGWDFRPFNMIFPERDRFSVMLNGTYELSNTLIASTMIQYSETDTLAARTPATGNDSDTFGPFDDPIRIGDIPADNPFIHPAVQETLSGTVDWRRRFVEVGFRDRQSNRATTRYSFGLDGQFNTNWYWSGYVGRGTYEQHQEKHNEVNRQHIQFALSVEADPDNPGGYRCIDAGARANGCVPLNVFGVGSITPAMADYIRHTIMLEQKLTQTTASFIVNGDAWSLPAGNVQMAFGLDYRKEEQVATGDPVTNAGLTSSSTLLDIDAEFDVTEAFVEFNVPLIADRPGIKALDLATAFRYADYSTIGNVSSWNLGLSFAPSDNIRFRGQISQAQRAPDITELFSPQRSDFDSFNDPCDGVTADTSGVVADNCRAEPGIAATIAANGIFEEDGSSIFGPNIGNPNLIEETADTVTFGVVFTPERWDGFSFIADYYKIEVEDAISSVNSQLAAELCYADVNFTTNRFCDSITRDADGQVSRIINQEENLNSIISEGIDVTMAYEFEFPRIPGQFKAKFNYAYIMKNESNFDGPDGEVTDDFLGEVGLPENESRFTLNWKHNNWRLRYRLKYTGSVRDDNDPDPEDVFGFITFDSVYVHDLYASYTLDRDHRYRFYAGIKNIGNEHGPYLPDGYASGSNFNVNSNYDRVGRRFYAGMKFTW